MRIAFVVQRYGCEVNGGAEHHCRMLAEHIIKYINIEVITTCAKDYITWRDEYEPGKVELNGVVVWRFPVDVPRNIKNFDKLSEKIFKYKNSKDEELKWMKLQGPYTTQLLNFISDNKNKYDYFIFFTYLYCTTFFGLPLVKDKAILIPTAHDEPPIYLSIFESLFKLPRAIIYNTPEEKTFINNKFNNTCIINDIIGVGIDIPENIDPEGFKRKYGVNNFIIYAGRIDESKGCRELFNQFMQYKIETQSNIKLVLLGKPTMDIPSHPDIVSLGFVSEQDKFNGIKASELLIMPSKYESLSMVILESWLCSNAVLVNGNCPVLKGQVIRSNGGLYYQNYGEFKECLDFLLKNDDIRIKMGKNGKNYVERNYGWERVVTKYIMFLENLGTSRTS